CPPAAAVPPVLDRCLVREVAVERLGAGAVALDQRPRTAYGLGLEVAATDRAPRTPHGDDHLGTGLARGVAADVGHRHQDAGLPVLAERCDRLPPGGHTWTPDRTRSRAQ